MDIYEQLAGHLDRLPGGFERTESGVEIRILQRLFSPEEAELALLLTLRPARAGAIAERAGIAPAEAAERLETMARKGLILSLHREGRRSLYAASQFVVGIFEFQVARMDEELARLTSEYLSAIPAEKWQRAPQMRTIPVGESISQGQGVLPYEQAELLLQGHEKFRVSPCICRKKEQLLGHGCSKPLETCLTFGAAADFMGRTGAGRPIDREEALSILAQANEAGLVLQPGNTQRTGFICCCCGDCCGVLQIAKRHPQPARVLVSAFFAEVDTDACSACGDCELRCQMEAIEASNGYAVVNLDRCIGCGLCVTTCPEQAVTLVRKSPKEEPLVPATDLELYSSMLRSRGIGRA